MQKSKLPQTYVTIPDEKPDVSAFEKNEQDKHTEPEGPVSVQGEQSVSGGMPDVESDDDTLKNAQAVGLQLNEDTEHPKELDLGGDINHAEEYQREH